MAREDAGSIFDMGIDDIDHLEIVGYAQLENCSPMYVESGLARTERVVRERMTLYDQGVEKFISW